MPQSPADIAAKLPRFENHAEQETHFTTCYMCACRCGIKVTTENEQIRFIQGNRNHPVNKGVLCGKGNAGIMKQNSPAKLKHPMRRKSGSERGSGEFEAISWDEALDILTKRLKNIRDTDPKKLAFFTGRDQMQALTGLWASQFGTINWAAHGGFCSVNMASAGLYTTGHSFWEFGDPDWDNTRYFMLWGVAEDHASNPIKIGLEKLKKRGAKFVAINPVRTGYQAIADEWIAIKPGTDGIFALSMVHVLLRERLIDEEFLVRYTNAPQLIIQNPGGNNDGLVHRDQDGNPTLWCQSSEQVTSALNTDANPALVGEYTTDDGILVKTAMSLILESYLDEQYAPEQAAKVCGIDAADIERLALEMAHVAFKETIEIKTPWVDWAGREHESFIGRPVSMHAMRGVSAHSNGFQTCRGIHLLQALLGTIDCPGGHLAKPPYPKHIAPPIKPAKAMAPNTPLSSPPLGFPTSPDDLVIDDDGNPLRIDKAYSWDAPLANHGLMHMVIKNAVNADPYPIDTLILFMANMAWNSSMNTAQTMEMLKAKNDDGEYKIPFIVCSDAFHSETVDFADLILPDTTYLERYDTISILDRPISEAHMACDAIRQPIINPDRDVRPWQEVLIDLAGRLKFPQFTNDEGKPRYEGYEDFIVNYEKSPGIGFLAGWRGDNQNDHLLGEPNPEQWERYKENECFFEFEFPDNFKYFRHANKEYLEFAQSLGWVNCTDQIVIELYSEKLQSFRLAALGQSDGPQPQTQAQRDRILRYFEPLPIYYQPLEQQEITKDEYPFFAITQRPMHMYHSWDSQNSWLRQITSHNYLYMSESKALELGIADLGWVWVESHNAKIRAQVKHMQGVQADTVWTWNAIGKRKGNWGLSKDAPESNKGFLLNHLISESLPKQDGITNSDPITGQAAWYDLKVKITPCYEKDDKSWPQFEGTKNPMTASTQDQSYQCGESVNLKRSLKDSLFKK